MNEKVRRQPISVVIPNYNGRSLLEKHLPAVFAAFDVDDVYGEDNPGDEVIVVDDASTDDSVSFLSHHFPKVRILQHEKNMRFAQSCNDGVAAARHEIVVLLNSDVSPQKDFLDPLLDGFKETHVFVVGCMEINNDGVQSGRAGGRFERGLFVHWRAQDQTKHSTMWAAGGSMAVRRSIWNEIGGMDTLFLPAYEEDRDLSYRAMKMGYTVRFAPESVVHHHHETTNKTALGMRELTIASHKNALLFYWKNITDTRLVLSHMFWLPYHLVFDGIRSKGLFILGFFRALWQLPQVLQKRSQLKKLWKHTDAEVIQRGATE